ncbi:DNA translocase FtsK [bacterium]|nr:MAG: DNA translocase FtsK [bacterium]
MQSKKKTSPKTRTSGTAKPKIPQKPPPKKGLNLNLSTKLKEEIVGILLMTFCVLLLLAIVSHRPNEHPASIMELWRANQLANFLGVVGAYISYYLVYYTFGYAFIAVPTLFFVCGWLLFTHRSIFLVNQFAFYILTLMVIVSTWLALPYTDVPGAGWSASGFLGGMIATQLFIWLNKFGSIAIWVVVSLVWVIMVTRISIADLIPAIKYIFVTSYRQTTETISKFKNRQSALLEEEKRKTEKLAVQDGETLSGNASEALIQEGEKPFIPQYLKKENQVEDAVPPDQSTPNVVEEKKPEVPVENTKPKFINETTGTKEIQKITKTEVKPNEKNDDITGFESGMDTQFMRDVKSLGHIEKQFVIPSIDFDNTQEVRELEAADRIAKKMEGIESTTESAQSAKFKEKTEENPTVDLSNVDFKDIAKNAFDAEHGDDYLRVDTDQVEQPDLSFKKEETRDDQEISEEQEPVTDEAGEFELRHELIESTDVNEINDEKPIEKTKVVSAKEQIFDTEIDFDKENQAARKRYRHPSLDLLEPTQEIEKLTEEQIQELDQKIHLIIKTLSEFGIDTKVVATEYNGPVVAIYQLELPTGLKISKITGLEDELALSMKVKSVRMVPVTSKGTIQVEIPKPKASPVLIRSLFEDKYFKNVKHKYKLGLALGKTIDGEIHFEDLAKMPHLLIAGTTGSGKSVGVNSFITSLLYQFDPSDVKFVMVDPKKVELALYRRLKDHHLICLRNQRGEIMEDVITKPENAKLMLKALVEEMEDRYEKLAHANVRNIEDYNKRWHDGSLPDDGKTHHYKLEYIVAIIDELADLMMTAPREVETSITRLAQMARAVGIHLIVATQRPSVDVLTGLIKANFPARIAYQVRSKIDSRTILDMGGAELLLGKGDMLYLPPGAMPIRIQNAFTSTRETESIVEYISKMPPFPRKDFVMKEEPRENVDGESEAGAYDALFNEALDIVVKHNQGSASLLQRRLSIGYARAARIVDQLERAGVVTAQDGGKARQVLITEDQVAMYRA